MLTFTQLRKLDTTPTDASISKQNEQGGQDDEAQQQGTSSV